jgi:hypothetical protein
MSILHDAQMKAYRACLKLLPLEFGRRYGSEMIEIAEARIVEDGVSAFVSECANVIVTAVRIRLGRYPLQVPALVVMVLLLMMMRGTGSSASNVVDFKATDPAGEFTLQVRNGRVIAGTLDRQPLSRRQLVHVGDSIRVLNQRGRVVFAVAYDPGTSTIEWTARPAACRGRVLDCGDYQ